MPSLKSWRALAAAALFSGTICASINQPSMDILPAQMALTNDRPNHNNSDCPPCFNCLFPAFECGQFAFCNPFNARCECPVGFGGDQCMEPVCGAPADGSSRPVRTGKVCDCNEGWRGINCNVCQRDDVCNALMPDYEGGVCLHNAPAVKENFQMCEVTNRKIRDLLEEKVPQVTIDCKKREETCAFQFWVDGRESFYCGLKDCKSSTDNTDAQNATNYECEKVQCKCIPDRMLCGEDGSIDITEFLDEGIKGPATIKCLQLDGGANKCAFDEPGMNDLISSVFGDKSITLECDGAECVHETDVPGYRKPGDDSPVQERPVKKINTPLIAGVIAGCSLFLVAVILIVWFLSRRNVNHGPIFLDDSDDENSKLMSEHKPASLYFENVDYSLEGKQILSDIQGVARPGQVMAIMGASGAGKTTFLDILARKNKRGTVRGDFFVNGEKVDDAEYRNVVGFVDQEDTMLSTLTVHETIITSAMLRLPKNMGKLAKEQRVHEVEKQLGILHIRDSLIGSEEGKGRGISGGEKRRVGIACELVTSPSILFLDEPTSGLDAYNAYNVIECLVTLAKKYNRTVIFTIHQPRSNIVALFDQLVLLAKGEAVYSGEFNRCQDYFESIGYVCPPGFNIADYLVDLTMHVAPTSPIDEHFIEENPSIGPSSTRGVKSIASFSGVSLDESIVGSIGDAVPVRPKNSRQDSVKAKQDRKLFTRKPSAIDSIIGGESSKGKEKETSSLLKLHRQQASKTHSSLLDDTQGQAATLTSSSSLELLVGAYKNSDIAGNIHEDIQASISSASQSNGYVNGHANGNGHTRYPKDTIGKGYARVSYVGQFAILSQRTWRNLYRNPMLMLTHYAIAIVLAVLSGWLFYGLTDDIKGFQNRLGLFFFLLALFGFSTLTSLNVFASERLLFVRERANGYYAPVTYFLAKVVFDIVPLRIVPPLIMGAIVYPMTGLVPDASHFFTFLFVLVLFNLAAAAICLFIGIVCCDGSVANLIGSLVMLFSLLFAGLLLNSEAIPSGAKWLQKLSIFHYGLETLVVNEVTYLTLVDRKYGLDISVPGASILSSFGFNTQALWGDIASLGAFAGLFVVLAYVAMHILLVERR